MLRLIFLALLGAAFAPSPFSRTYRGPYASPFAAAYGPYGISSLVHEPSSSVPIFFPQPITGSTNKPASVIKPTDRSDIFDVVYEWNILDYAFNSPQDRERAIMTQEFVPENNLPLGIDRWKNT